MATFSQGAKETRIKAMVTEIIAKTALTRAVLPEVFLPSLYRCAAPYRGCGHGCQYCDGRAEKYYVDGDFERDIAVRANLPALAAADAAAGYASREWGALCIGSGVTDVYQGLEKNRRLTRATLEALSGTGLPLVILTKSDTILRDFDILARFPKVLVILTITTLDAGVAALLEPGAVAPERRLAVIKAAREAGFSSGVMAMPLCPAISDAGEDTSALFSAIKKAGGEFIWSGGLTLRPGRQKELFMDLVKREYPRLVSLYDDVYGENRASGMPRLRYAEPTMRAAAAQLRELDIPAMIPHHIHRQLLSPSDSLFVLFAHMKDLYSYRGVDTRPLQAATERYAAWLAENRTALRRKRIAVNSLDPFPITRILTERLRDLFRDGGAEGFTALCGNRRLAETARSIVMDDQIFDYCALRQGPEPPPLPSG